MAHTPEGEHAASIVDRFQEPEIRDQFVNWVEQMADGWLEQGFGQVVEEGNLVRLDHHRGAGAG